MIRAPSGSKPLQELRRFGGAETVSTTLVIVLDRFEIVLANQTVARPDPIGPFLSCLKMRPPCDC